jgi:hypothetical protein
VLSADAELSPMKKTTTKMEDLDVPNVVNHFAKIHTIKGASSMDNAKLFMYHFKTKKRVPIETICTIIDYWYEWIFREEIYEKVVKYGGF